MDHTSPRKALDLAMLDAFARRFGDALAAGDGPAADGVIDEALATGTEPAAIQSLVITPAMIRIGELWSARALTVADEHLATSVAQRALLRLFEVMCVASVRPRSRERVLLAAVQGQRHVLGLRMVADVLEVAGYDVLHLGEGVPVEDLREFVAKHQPAVVGLSLGVESDVGVAMASLAAIHDVTPQTRIMLGGRAVPPALWSVGYPRVFNTMEVARVVEDLLAGPPQPLPAIVDRLRTPARPAARPAGAADRDFAAERLSGLADEAHAVARRHVRRAETFRDLAFRDPLTNLANRRGFEDHLHAYATGPPTGSGALLILDVDAFKAVNDERGHLCGDRVLAAVGRTLKDCVRPVDVPARIGGDEFAVLMPGASVALAGDVGDRIRAAVAAEAEPSVSVSVGVAALQGDARGALLAADTALYEAKASGRNGVVGDRLRRVAVQAV